MSTPVFPGLRSSSVAFYLVPPFGWSGSPGFFAHIASGIPKWHNARDPPNPENSGGESIASFLFADDGILAEPNLGTRCGESALCWGKECGLTLCPNSTSVKKLDEEGKWETEELAL